ncbi:MAG: hypothetical protein K2J39_08020 [Ruminococcus sp.]|nr:hypothetical protein [Ruminococcus sp.]
MQVIQSNGFMLIECSGKPVQTVTNAIKLLRNGSPIEFIEVLISLIREIAEEKNIAPA